MKGETKAADLLYFYHGEPKMITPSPAGGYEMDCPRCGTNQWFAPDATEGHAIWRNEGGNAEVRPSVVCMNDGCGLHILIENGEARDV